MLRKNLFLNICGNNVMNLGNEKRDMKGNESYANVYSIENFEELKFKVRNRKLYIMLEGEEIHVKLLKLPKVYDEKLDNMIEREMIYLYGSRAEDIYYDYSIFKKNENDLDVLVFCVNCELLSNMKKCDKFKNNIKKVSLVQMYFIEYFKKYILEKKYILISRYYNKLYFTAVCEDAIIANKVLKSNEDDYDILVKGINYIKDRILFINVNIDNIYTCNINNNKLEEYLSDIKDIKYKRLGELKESIVIDYFLKNRR